MNMTGEIYLVRVLTDDGQNKLFAAATPRDEAVDAVLNAIPEGWVATLYDGQLSTQQVLALDLEAGQVREITSGTN